MAEGGGEDKENPFSFQSFIKKSKHSQHSNRNEDDNSSDPDIFDTSHARSSSAVQNDVENGVEASVENSKKKKEDSDDENPFSFKKFLKSGPRPKTNGHLISRLDLANDLPDFVQDHFPHEHSHRNVAGRATSSHRLPTDVPLPDFALDSENSDIFSSTKSSSHESSLGLSQRLEPPPSLLRGLNPPDISHPQGVSDFALPSPPLAQQNESNSRGHSRQGSGTSRGSFTMDGPEPDLQHIDLPVPGNEPARLPDFLSDSAAATLTCFSSPQNSEQEDSSSNHSDLAFINGDAGLELKRLQDENRELRRQLKQARSTVESQNRRIEEVTKEKERIEKREVEENTALESMVQQVEANLVLTTQRAVAAENTITKLKHEIKSLQVTVSTLQMENENLKSSRRGQDPVRDKALHASEQLTVAATNAEQMLKQLLTGVEKIKLISSVLASVDKITEEGATGPTS